MRRSTISKLLAAGLGGVLASAVGAAPANAVSVGDVFTYAGYAKTAYDTYQQLFGNQMTLEQATQQIKNAITAAQTQIIAEIDRVQADLVRSCARTAVIDYADIDRMSFDQVQSYATNTTNCVTDGWSLITDASDPAAVDEMGFALNLVGPLALSARARAYGVGSGGAVLLRETIIQANQRNLVRLTPTCSATRGEVVNGLQEIALVCRAYNGDTGDGVARIGVGAPLPTFDYSAEITQAVQRTSYPVSVASLDGLLEDPVVAPPGNQTTIWSNPVSLALSASHGAPPYQWKVTGLPPGLTVNSQGLIGGAPSLVATFTVRATATDTQGQLNTATFTWTVVDKLALIVGPLGDRTTPVGTPVSLSPAATGGKLPYTWSVTGLPAGLSANAAGQITGTVAPSPYTNIVTITATDAAGQHASKSLTWTVPAVVPNVQFWDPSSAEQAIAAAGLVAADGGSVNDCLDPGNVSSQSPRGGTQVPPGTRVFLTLSTCTGGGEPK